MATSTLLFLTPGFPKDEADSTCLPAVHQYVAACAAARPGQVRVIAFQYPFTRSIYTWHGAVVHTLGGHNRSGLQRLPTWARAARVALALHRQRPVQALHSFWLTECAWVAQQLNRVLRAPHVASIGGQDARADNPYLRRLDFERMTVTAGSPFAAETFRASTGRPVEHVIPLGLDVEHLDSLPEPDTRDIDVIGVGSLIPLKDYAAFVRVVASVRSAFPGLRVLLVGDGPERAALERQIREAGLERTIRLTGELPRDEVYRTMLRSRVLLHPSTYEGQGYVFLEALHAGCSVVCRPVGYTGAHPKAFPCASEREMADRLCALLAGTPVHDHRAVVSMHDTVAAFAPLYLRSER